MNLKEYKKLYGKLNTYDDVARLSEKTDYDKELLFVIFTQKHIREVKKKYYQIEGKSHHLLKKWKKGKSFTQLAKEECFSPVMMAQILLRKNGLTKKQTSCILRDHEEARDTRVKKEVKDAIEKDMVYSELGAQLQRERGKQGEAIIHKWLTKKGLKFQTEEDLKGKGSKTVDFLLDKPFKVRFETHPEEEREIHWIESKGSFGDTRQIRRDYKKQLSHYVKLWGPGMVVYWYDFLEGLELWLEARDVKLVKRDFFEGGEQKKKQRKKTRKKVKRGRRKS
jgi:hypothetical protein